MIQPSLAEAAVDPSPPVRRWLPPVLAAAVVAILVGIFLLGYLPRAGRRAALATETAATSSARPPVRVQRPRLAPGTTALRLPGSIEPSRATGVYARASGYVTHWLVDLGADVAEGQLLAEIDVPEIQQQLIQSRAALAQSQAGIAQADANLVLARINLERVKSLAPGVMSQQDIDTRQADYDVMSANLGMARAKADSDAADVHRLVELVSFSRITAPFAGTITRRSIEVGNLVNGGSGSQALFELAQSDPVRVVVDAPQPVAPSLTVGLPATITQRGTPGSVTAPVARIAKSLSPTTRSMRVEISVPNPDGRLLPGMYAEVAFSVPDRAPLLMIDSAALLQSADGTQVAVVGDGDRIRLAKVVVALDNGNEIGISEGLTVGDRVVVNPAGRIREGVEVAVAPADAPANPPANSPAK